MNELNQIAVAAAEKWFSEFEPKFEPGTKNEMPGLTTLTAIIKTVCEERDMQWWDACCGVPGVAVDPQAVKKWIAAEASLMDESRAASVPEPIWTALEKASKLNTGQGCPEENYDVVITAMDALKLRESYMAFVPAKDETAGEPCSECDQVGLHLPDCTQPLHAKTEPCYIHGESSRMCECGTKSCVTEHGEQIDDEIIDGRVQHDLGCEQVADSPGRGAEREDWMTRGVVYDSAGTCHIRITRQERADIIAALSQRPSCNKAAAQEWTKKTVMHIWDEVAKNGKGFEAFCTAMADNHNATLPASAKEKK